MKDVYKVPAHKYNFAGFMNKVAGDPDKDGNLTSGAFAGMSGSVASGLGALGSAVGGMAGSAIAGGRTSPAGDIIGGLGDIASAIPGPWGAVAGAGLKVIGGLTNAAFGVKLNQENINAVNNNISSMNNFQSNASSFDDLAQNINSQPTAMRFNQDFIGKNGWFNKGATKKFNQLQAQQDMAQQFVDNSLNNNMNNLVNTQSQNLLANYAAKGGPLETHGSEWSTGLNYIGSGGSHEQNPNGGIQQGIAPDGLPNLVEEGEVIWNGDYVFSKRLKVPKAVRNKYKLRGTKPMSFADAALEFNKEMDERPNDPISKRGRDGMLAKLADVQEEKRAKIQAKEQAQQAAMMGMMGMPQDQMAMQEQPVQDDVMSEANQEELARQEIMQGMQQPMVEGYAAKGGPIGHKFANAGAKPNVSDEVANWWRQFWKLASKDRTYFDWGDDVFNANKDKFTKYSDLTNMIKKFSNADKMLETANDGKVGDVSNLINLLYNNRNVRSNSSYFPRQFEWTDFGSTQTYPIPVQSGRHDIDWMMRYSNYLGEMTRAKMAGEVPDPNNYGEYRGIKFWSSPRDIARTLTPTSLDWNNLTAYRHGLASIPQRWRDEQGNILYDENNNVKTVPNQYEQIKINPAQGRYEFNKETGKLGYVPPTTVQRFGLQTPQLELSPEIRNYGIRSLINSGNGQLLIDAQKQNPIVANAPETKSGVTNPADGVKSNYPWQGYLRYMPAIGAGLGVFSDLMGWTNKPDYSAADALLNASTGVRDVSFRPIGDYAQYRPVDTRFALNTLNGAAGATRRGIMNTSAGNRGTAMAGMLAADNNYMNSIGNTLFTAENANYDRYLKALAHNTDVNKFNSEGFLKAAMANQGAGEVRAKYAAMAADARQKALALASANRSANLTNLFDSLGNIGIDALNRADARWLAQFWKGANAPSISAKHGGRIKKRRRGRVI